ncbi:MAG: cadmium-translocating P-type ATPase, partial [Sphingopyxis terrae]
SGMRALWINRDFNINFLMTIAAVGAILIGETLEAATVVFLFAVGEALEGYTTDRARQSIRSLMSLAPARALRLVAGREEEVPIEALAINDTILVKPGERIPMDGEVLRGESGVDQSPVTGESVPALKTGGDEVFAGTINGSGTLEIRVLRLAADNTIQRIIRMVEEAQSARAPSQRLIDQFARVYTPAVVLIAAVVAIAPPLLFNAPFYDMADGTHGWLYRAVSVLVIACPCALVISTPVTVISAITAAARKGVLIKGGSHLEMLGRVRAFAFDKTGTLTRGKPVVTAVRAIDCTTGEPCEFCNDVLALASAVERRSAHPLARAVADAAETRGLGSIYAPAEAVESLAGQGVQGHLSDKLVTVGSHS